MRERIFFIIASILLLFVVVLSPDTVLRVQNFLFRSRSAPLTPGQSESLFEENQRLHAEVERLLSIRGQFSSSTAEFIPAIVFSHYPFNFKNEITINAGSNQGVKQGKLVLVSGRGGSANPFADGFLFGYIDSVGSETSVIRTLLDARWSSSARIGRDGVDALFSGGVSPSLGFIPKDTRIVSGDSVYSTDARFPYGVPIGRVLKVRESEDKAFQTAIVELGYEINRVRTVYVMK